MKIKCPLNLILNISKQTSHEYPKSSLAQNGVLIEQLYWKYVGHLKDQIEIMVA